MKEGVRSGLLSAPYQNGDQHYDVGLLCSIRVQTYARTSRGSLCSLPRKLTKVTPSGGVKVNLAEKTIFFILLISAQLIHF